MITVKFDNPDLTINNIQGYRIAGRLNPRDGLQSEFYVYVASTIAGRDQLQTVAFDANEGDERRGNLTIGGEYREYSFGSATLTRIQAGATRRERYQILEFQVNFQPQEQPEVQVSNDDTAQLQRLTTFKDEFKFKIGGDGNEHLLGFAAFQPSTGSSVYQFSSLRNGQNSWVRAALGWQKAIRIERNEKYSLGLTWDSHDFNLNSASLGMLYFDESYGVCQRWGGLSLKDVISWGGGGAGEAPTARLPIWEYTIDDLVEHDNQSRGEFAVPTVRRAAEIATLVFNAGYYRDIAVK